MILENGVPSKYPDFRSYEWLQNQLLIILEYISKKNSAIEIHENSSASKLNSQYIIIYSGTFKIFKNSLG